jgi:hypothetical protein
MCLLGWKGGEESPTLMCLWQEVWREGVACLEFERVTSSDCRQRLKGAREVR